MRMRFSEKPTPNEAEAELGGLCYQADIALHSDTSFSLNRSLASALTCYLTTIRLFHAGIGRAPGALIQRNTSEIDLYGSCG